MAWHLAGLAVLASELCGLGARAGGREFKAIQPEIVASFIITTD